jgi:prevent-host-death family protein
MPTIGIRELSNNTSSVVEEVSRSGRPMLVTKNGKPVAALVAVDEDALLDYVLATSPEYVRSINLAQSEIAQGDRGRDLEEVLAELNAEE